jgi:uncharacterized protein
MEAKLEEKLSDLTAILGQMGSVVIAYSGGADSTLLLQVARNVLKDRVIAVTGKSPIYSEKEYEQALTLAKQIGVKHLSVITEEVNQREFSDNPPNRCYYCKRELFLKLLAIARQEGLEWVADGTNWDDLKDHRPGRIAAEELGVRSPLCEAHLTKEDIRALSRELGLPTWNKPAQACLASRIPYGTTITATKLERISQAEDYLLALGLRQVRVRDHGSVARIEVEREDIGLLVDEAQRLEVVNKLKSLGYVYVAVDLGGYRTGSLNEVLETANNE